jgi:hypothetical protein
MISAMFCKIRARVADTASTLKLLFGCKKPMRFGFHEFTRTTGFKPQV